MDFTHTCSTLGGDSVSLGSFLWVCSRVFSGVEEDGHHFLPEHFTGMPQCKNWELWCRGDLGDPQHTLFEKCLLESQRKYAATSVAVADGLD